MSGSRDYITQAESDCLAQLETERKVSREEIDSIQQILWMNFHDSAKYTATLYKDRTLSSPNLLCQFQTCAIAITQLYKDSLDAVERAFELGQQLGAQSCRRDISSWAKRRRRKLNRLELFRMLTRKGGTNCVSDTESDELTGSLSTMGVASPRTAPRSPSTSGESSGIFQHHPSPPRTSATAPSLHSRKRKASSLFDEFLETVHEAKKSRS